MYSFRVIHAYPKKLALGIHPKDRMPQNEKTHIHENVIITFLIISSTSHINRNLMAKLVVYLIESHAAN